MAALRMNKIAERVTLLQTDGSGNVTSVTLYKKKRKKSKDTWRKRPGTTAMNKIRRVSDNAFKMMDNTLESVSKGDFPM